MNIKGLTHSMLITRFKANPEQQVIYLRIIKSLLYYDHTFAVSDGRLYLSSSAVDRLVQSGLVLPQSLSEEL